VIKDEALQMAIDALLYGTDHTKAVKACKEALEQPTVAELNDEYLRDTYVVGLNQPAQKPVAWMHRHAGEITEFNDFQSCQYCEPLYTHPAPSWQGLSNDMVRAIGEKCEEKNRGILNWIDFYNAIESMLKEKNYEQH